MLDLKLLEKDFDSVAAKLKAKKVDENLLKNLQICFVNLKKERAKLEEAQAFQNKFSKELASASDKENLKAKLNENKAKINELNSRVNEIQNELLELAHSVPNIPDECVPVGDDENDNVELKKVGELPKFDFKPKEHFELGE